MRLAIMQPYFLPYVGYFSLIAATDRFVVFDPVQFIRHGWINRNKILKPDFETPQYIKVPLSKHSRQTLIRKITISETDDWKKRIFRQLEHYKNKAPYYGQAIRILNECFEINTPSIVELNVHCLKTVCDAIGLPFNFSYFDSIENEIGPVFHPGEWALQITLAMNANTYVNPIGGRDIFDADQFLNQGLELNFLENSLTKHPQRRQEFASLSIIDGLMFYSLEETLERVNDYTVTTAQSNSPIARTLS